MSIIELEIKSTKFRYLFKLQRRINFIMGNSGVGKTACYDLIDSHLRGNSDIMLRSTFPIQLVHSISDIEMILSAKLSDRIIFVDDLDLLVNKSFLALYEKQIENNYWFIIMSREDLSSDFKTTLTFSSNCLYRLECNNNSYTLAPLYNVSNIELRIYDCVIVEDSKGGYDFFSKIFKNMCPISTSRGKNNIVRELKSAVNKGYYNILVIYDSASFGSNFQEFYNYASHSDSNIDIISHYECFEELLVNTDLLRHLSDIEYGLDNLEYEANKFSSWERYFEYLIQKATDQKPYKYSHNSKLRNCYTESCNKCNEYIKEKCDYNRKQEEKIKGLLRGSKYEFLLKYYLER